MATVMEREKYRSAADYDVHTLRHGMRVRLSPIRNGSQNELELDVDALKGFVSDVNPRGFSVYVRKGSNGPHQQHIVLWGSDTALGGAFTAEVQIEQEFYR